MWYTLSMLSKLKKLTSVLLCFLLILQQTSFAQTLDLFHYFANPTKPALPSDKFRPLHLRYLGYDNLNQDFKLLLDKGDTTKDDLENKTYIEENTQTLLKYFFIGLALPNEKFWVNLRPDSPDNILDPDLEKTDIGRIFLEADVQLKKDTAGMTSPQTPEGKAYWDKLYKKAGELFGTENITIPTITRPWIVPNEIIIREASDNAYIYKATLKVMLEEDYLSREAGSRNLLDTLAGKNSQPSEPNYQPLTSSAVGGSAFGGNYNFSDPRLKELNQYSTQLIKETIIPKLTYEVNTSKRYAPLRQVYYSLILAQWFKARYRSQRTENRLQITEKANNYLKLIDSGNLTNLTSTQPYDKQSYFKQYQKSFKDGEYNLTEPVYTPMGQSIRRYMSGGMFFGEKVSSAIEEGKVLAKERFALPLANSKYIIPERAQRLPVLGLSLEDIIRRSRSLDTACQEAIRGLIQAKTLGLEEIIRDIFIDTVKLFPGRSSNHINLHNPDRKELLRELLRITGIEIEIVVNEIAAARAANGLINAMGLGKDYVVIRFTGEVDETQARKQFPGFKVEAVEKNVKNRIFVEFFDYGLTKVRSRIDLQYYPFKFFANESVSQEEKQRIKRELNIGQRKIFVIGSPFNSDLKEFSEVYSQLYKKVDVGKRPLVIVAPRERRDSIALSVYSFFSGSKIEVRNNVDSVFPNMQDANVLILNTSGELLKVYAIGDVCIVGEDRNILEPASHSKAVLYFGEYWFHNRKAKEILEEMGGALRFNKENLELLVNNSARNNAMGNNGFEAIEVFQKKIIPDAGAEVAVWMIFDIYFNKLGRGNFGGLSSSGLAAESALLGENQSIPANPEDIKKMLRDKKIDPFFLDSPNKLYGKIFFTERGKDLLDDDDHKKLFDFLWSRNKLPKELKAGLKKTLKEEIIKNREKLNSVMGSIVEGNIKDEVFILLKMVLKDEFPGDNNAQDYLDSIKAFQNKKGGIDFAALPIVTQQIKSLQSLSASPLFINPNFNLDAEWAQIQQVFNAGIRPSVQRLVEFSVAAASSPAESRRKEDVIGLIADLLRREEEDKKLTSTDSVLKSLLTALET
ncbi:MAG: hypothetical protein Q7J72_05740 [Candidatus Omnitrophota bacterium]|nr:hypothetical protein [Candidatus Omnitrophota bacterium]